jgi:single-stranded DNA-binding protein
MAYFNHVVLVGNATKAAEAKTGKKSESAYATFHLAQRHYKAEQAQYYRVVVFDPLRESVVKHVKRGRLLLVAGRLDLDDKARASIVANRVEFLGPPTDKQQEAPGKAKLRKKAERIRATKKAG